MAKHTINHVQWSVTDMERAKAFYGGLFGWSFETWGDNYTTFKPPEGLEGGLMKVDQVKPGQSPYIYIEVEELEPYLERARELGGGVDVPKTEIPQIGWFAHLTDPDGNIVGLFQGLPK